MPVPLSAATLPRRRRGFGASSRSSLANSSAALRAAWRLSVDFRRASASCSSVVSTGGGRGEDVGRGDAGRGDVIRGGDAVARRGERAATFPAPLRASTLPRRDGFFGASSSRSSLAKSSAALRAAALLSADLRRASARCSSVVVSTGGGRGDVGPRRRGARRQPRRRRRRGVGREPPLFQCF